MSVIPPTSFGSSFGAESSSSTNYQLSQRPIPKPRKNVPVKSSNPPPILLNNELSLFTNSPSSSNSSLVANVTSSLPSHQTSQLSFSSNKMSVPPTDVPPRMFSATKPTVPPPLPPRNLASQLPAPLSLDERTIESIRSAIANNFELSKKTVIEPAFSKRKQSTGDLIDMDESMPNGGIGRLNSLCSMTSIEPATSCDSYYTASDSGSSSTKIPEESEENLVAEMESVCFSGWVNLSSKKDVSNRRRCYSIIRSNQISFMEDEESEAPFFPTIDLYCFIYVGRSVDNPSELVLIYRDASSLMISGNSKNSSLPWSCIRFIPEDNIDFWLILLARSNNPQSHFVRNSVDSLNCCGKLWIRQGITGVWMEGWALITNHILRYCIGSNGTFFELNIRKIVLLRRDVPSNDFCNYIKSSQTGPLLIAQEGSSLYLQAECDICTDLWFASLNTNLNKNATLLEESRLTADNVPVIVDKCIRLVSTYGLYQPGIYRRNGSAALARDLMKDFREDPYNVKLKSTTDEVINAVADILRSFFRQLEKPLIPTELHNRLYEISEMSDKQTKLDEYQAIVFSLPEVYFCTIKKLLAHLQEITTHSEKNLATIDNISKVFGPTLFMVDKNDEKVSVETYTQASRQTCVLRDLVSHFDYIFQRSIQEITAKTRLDEIQEQSQTPKARAAGFLVPIHLFEKDHKCFNVQCDWTASKVVSFRVEKLVLSSDVVSICDQYALFEVLRNGQLERRLSGDEVLTSIVLGRWLEWENSADSYLLLKKDVYQFQQQDFRPFADDVRIAEPGSKTFKHAYLRIESGTKVVQYTKNMKYHCEWNVDDMLWFVGHEMDRRPPYPHSLTFFLIATPTSTASHGAGGGGKAMPKHLTNSNKSKFAGFCVTFKDEKQKCLWLNSVIVCKQEYLPMPLIQL